MYPNKILEFVPEILQRTVKVLREHGYRSRGFFISPNGNTVQSQVKDKQESDVNETDTIEGVVSRSTYRCLTENLDTEVDTSENSRSGNIIDGRSV